MSRTLPLPAHEYIPIPGFPQLARHPGVLGGKPCIRGTRISADLILGFLANGSTVDEIHAEYDHLDREEIVAVVHYAAALLPGTLPRERAVA